MKTTDEIFAQFEDIPSLPFSEETIGAYLEGTLAEDEMIAVNDLISADGDFADFVSVIDPIDPYAIELGSFDGGDDTYIDLGGYTAETEYTESTHTTDHTDISEHTDLAAFTDQSDLSDLSDLSDISSDITDMPESSDSFLPFI